MTETQTPWGDQSDQYDQFTIRISKGLLNIFQDKLSERNENAETVITNFIQDYVHKQITQ